MPNNSYSQDYALGASLILYQFYSNQVTTIHITTEQNYNQIQQNYVTTNQKIRIL